MIVKMKKVILLTDSKYQQATLHKMRKMGVLHPHLIKHSGSEELRQIENDLEKTDKALLIIGNEASSKPVIKEKDTVSILNQILSFSETKADLLQELEKKLELHRWFTSWGKVSFTSFQKLKDAGIFIRFYIADKDAYKRLPADKMVYLIKREQNTVYFIFITNNQDEKLDYKEVYIPEVEISHLESEIKRIQHEISETEKSIKNLSGIKNALMTYREELAKKAEFNRVMLGMGKSDTIVYLQGFCPVDSIPEIKKMANKEGLAYIIRDPDDPAEVPTLLRNPRWLQIIQPLFSFMGILPGYAEQDVSMIFLAFFSIFYAMLVGDAGYGLIILLITLFFSRKNKKAPKEIFRLMYLLSFMTILWGLFSGTWFGSERIAQLPVLRLFIIDKIYSFSDVNQNSLMQLTFIIGVVHLSLARLLAAVQKMNSLSAIGELGWILILWAVYFLANYLVIGYDLPGIFGYLLLGGIVLVAVFSNYQKNIIKGVLLTLSNLPLQIISSFSDVVSYIRLFAVGLATVIVATSFNQMAIGSGINSIISGIVSVFILLLGHTLNITLALMAVLVHGVRLNMLEFSGHIGMQWTGKKYDPFKE